MAAPWKIAPDSSAEIGRKAFAHMARPANWRPPLGVDMIPDLPDPSRLPLQLGPADSRIVFGKT